MGVINKILDKEEDGSEFLENLQHLNPAYTEQMRLLQQEQAKASGIVYMTENESIPEHLRKRYWGSDTPFRSFGNLRDAEIEESIEDFSIFVMKQINDDPMFKDNPQAVRDAQQFLGVVKHTLRKSRDGSFTKSMTAVVNVSEQTYRQEEVKEKKKGIGRFFGLG